MARSATRDLCADVARILLELEGKTSFGSGRLIAPNLVLTAKHVVEAKDNGWEVRLLKDWDQSNQRWLGDPIPAVVVWHGKEKLDIAVLRLKGEEIRHPHTRLRFGRYDSVMEMENFWVAGFPDAARVQKDKAREYSAPAKLRKADQSGIYRLTVASANAPSDYNDWSGLSGAAVIFTRGKMVWLLGAVQQVPKAFGAGALEVAPVEAAFSDPEFEELFQDFDTIESLEKLPGAYEPVGAEAFAASRRIFDAVAKKPFYGRSADFERLDGVLTERDRGVILLRGEAGLGKSSFAAAWADRCSSNGDITVLRHAFSVREANAGTRADMVENLVRQVVFSLGTEELGEGEPGETRMLENRLATLLGRDQPEGMRLIVVLDALDEAAEPIEPWSTSIGRGVYLLATCRAEVDEKPAVLEMWHRRFEKDGTLALEHTLPALDAAAIAAWLTAEKIEATDDLVNRALKASEGVPLFAALLIPYAIEQLRVGAVDPIPSSFIGCASEQLKDLQFRIIARNMGRWSWQYVRNLFALLAVAKGPLPPILIEKLSDGATLDELDQRVERWLWRRPKMVSLAHPRLAPVFADVLSHFFDVVIEQVEDCLVRECEQAWGVQGNIGLNAKAYALNWLPAHLIGRKRLAEAADLLGDGAFHLARLASSPDEATVHRTASETANFERRNVGTNSQNLVEWRRFWSETEGLLSHSVANAARLGLQPTDILVSMARDRFGSTASAFRSIRDTLPDSPSHAPCIARPCGFQHPFLLRSIDDAHRGPVAGLCALDRRVVSGGMDGAIRFWDQGGEPIGGGSPTAHPRGVNGVLFLEDGRLVSWGANGAIRFWNREGQSILGGNAAAHAYQVHSVLSLEDGRLVSWGGDGAIRFWNREGQPIPGGDLTAHSHGVFGVIFLKDGRFVSWGADGAVRFWNRIGQAIPGGDAAAHPRRVLGLIALEDARLVSWDGDGAIRFWNREGQPIPGGDRMAHSRRVQGVLSLEDGRLVSWGDDGAIRFWNREGQAIPGGDRMAHSRPVQGVLSLEDGRLVSWGFDGAIRFWNREGQPIPGGDPSAHSRGVQGVLALEDRRLVSWGQEGAIRFWNRDRQPIPEGEPTAHSGGVWGMLSLEDGRMVSWGGDGAIHFWNQESQPIPGGDAKAHSDYVYGVLSLNQGRLVSWGADGAIRFWNREGQAIPGGDRMAHSRAVDGVLSLEDGRLVSWGFDGAIRFWSRKGQPIPGGDAAAHPRWVNGVLSLVDGRLVSWGGDGAIRFWNRVGQPIPGGDAAAHPRGVLGLIALKDGRLVSWGKDDAIRFWGRIGQPIPGGDAAAHPGGVLGLLSLEDGRLVSWGGDGAIRFWNPEGQPIPGGDPRAHSGGVLGVLFLRDGQMMTWGKDNVIRFWDHRGIPRGVPWFAPAPLEIVTVIGNDVWLSLLGRPYKLILNPQNT